MKRIPLKYLIVEYIPHAMDGDETRPARIDGHYADKRDAEDIAALWAERPIHPESRIVVCEILADAKLPADWLRRSA